MTHRPTPNDENALQSEIGVPPWTRGDFRGVLVSVSVFLTVDHLQGGASVEDKNDDEDDSQERRVRRAAQAFAQLGDCFPSVHLRPAASVVWVGSAPSQDTSAVGP